MTWEEAVKKLREDPANKQSVLDNYFEADIHASAERYYQSEEFADTLKYLPAGAHKILDIGAGRGIVSYAFAKKGMEVTALEPDPSHDVGAGAIRSIAAKAGLKIEVVESFGEQLPFADGSFDVVYARQVLHHAHNLGDFCREAARVLKPGGVMIAVREHVISKETDLDAFLKQHPLHKFYGGENAFTLQQYTGAITRGGLKLTHILHPYASALNYAPLSEKQVKDIFANALAKFTGKAIARRLLNVPAVFNVLRDMKGNKYDYPGRLYSFVAQK